MKYTATFEFDTIEQLQAFADSYNKVQENPGEAVADAIGVRTTTPDAAARPAVAESTTEPTSDEFTPQQRNAIKDEVIRICGSGKKELLDKLLAKHGLKTVEQLTPQICKTFYPELKEI